MWVSHRKIKALSKDCFHNLKEGLLQKYKVVQNAFEEGQIETSNTYRKHKELAHMGLSD
jgi:hypothetical protein